GLVGEKRLRVTDLPELVQTLDGWERDRTIMPPKRKAVLRAASRGLADITSGAALGASRDDGVVIDDDLLPDDEGAELRTIAPPLGALQSVGPSQAGPTPAPSLLTAYGASNRAGTAPAPPAPAGTAAQNTAAGAAAAPTHKRVSINPFEKKKQIWPLLL